MQAPESTETIEQDAPIVPEPEPARRAPAHEAPARRGALRRTIEEYWFYRELFFFFIWRDIKVRYKQTVLGAYWAVLQPFLTMIVFTLLFGKLAKLPNDGLPYPIFYYSGLLPWTYFSGAFSKASISLTGNVALITKVYFPRALIPTSAVLTGLIDFAVASLLLVVMMVYYGTAFSWELLLWPVLLLPLVVLALGSGLLLSALNVNYRDVKHTVPFLVQIGMFVSPVVYPINMIPEKWRWAMLLNPVAGVTEAYRAAVAPDRPIDWGALGISLVISLAIFAVGYAYFRRTERAFADTI